MPRLLFCDMKRNAVVVLLVGLLAYGVWHFWPNGGRRVAGAHDAASASTRRNAAEAPQTEQAFAPAVDITIVDAGSAVSTDEFVMQQIRDSTMTNPSLAEKLAREHQEHFPKSRNSDERDFLLVAAISNQHRLDEARYEAIHYFKRHPTSPYSDRLASALGMGSPQTPKNR